MRVEVYPQRMTVSCVFVRYWSNNHLGGCCVKSRQYEDKLLTHLTQRERSHQARLILLAFAPLERGQSPWATLQKNLKQIRSSNISVDCNFEFDNALIYPSSWNLRNNWVLWWGCSIELNALSKENLIWRSPGSACYGVIAVVVPITRSQVVTAGIPTGRAENDEGSTILQDPQNGWWLIRASLGSWEHSHHSSCSYPMKICTTTESLTLQNFVRRKWILREIYQVFLIIIMIIFITLLGIVATLNAIRAINQT